jgi:Domain of unknown function (DUF5010)
MSIMLRSFLFFILIASVATSADLTADFALPDPPGPYVSEASEPTVFQLGQPVIATSYFYWYDAATKAHVIDHDGTDALTDHPPTLKGFSYKNVDWHATQLEDMIEAGIDVALPVYWGEPTKMPQWSNEGLPPLVAARERLLKQGKNPPTIGMFYDTSTLRFNSRGARVDLTTPQGRLWFYGSIRDCFSLIPAKHRATIDGRPLVLLYASAFAKDVDEALFPTTREMFRKDFGTDLFLVKMRGWPGEADSEYQWGGAYNPQILDTAGIGPGYDHSAVPGRTPLIRTRDEGRFYRYAWEKLLDIAPAERPWLVHLETWNEFHEGTEVCETKEYGRQYIELTQQYADIFHKQGNLDPANRVPPIASVSATPDDSQGLSLYTNPNGDGVAEAIEVDGVKAWQTRPNRHSGNRYLYFDADYTFLYDGDETLSVIVEYLDTGNGQLLLEYDSADPTKEGIAQYFRRAGSQRLQDSGQWRQARFNLPHAHFAGRSNGGDFRLANPGSELTISRVVVHRKPK